MVKNELAGSLPPRLKLGKVIEILLDAGQAQKITMEPDKLLPHPKNRGGRMVVAADVEYKGGMIVTAGAKMELIGESIAFELPEEGPMKQHYLGLIQELVDSSGGKLAPISGKEVALTVASSHTTAFCRMSIAGTKTANDKLANNAGYVQPPEAFKGDFAQMCRTGWSWVLIRRDVEKLIPELPAKFGVLNALHAVGSKAGEIETVKSIAEMLETGTSKQDAIDQAVAGAPICQDYIAAIASYAEDFSGGKGAPLLKCLDDYTKRLGLNTCQVGSDFVTGMVAISSQSKTTTLPFCRLACWMAQSTALKVVDGISRMITTANLRKLASKDNVSQVESIEQLIKNGYEFAQSSSNPNAVMQFGKFATRSIVHFFGIEKVSREPDGFKSLGLINQLYLHDIGLGPKPDDVADPKAAALGADPKAEVGLSSLSDASDPCKIALRKFTHLKIDGLFVTPEHPGTVCKLKSIDSETAKLTHKPFFGNEETITVPWDSLKKLKPFKGNIPPELHSVPEPNLPENLAAIQLDIEKAEVFQAMMAVYKETSCNEDLLPCTNPTSLYIQPESEGYKRGELYLGMVGLYGSLKKLTSKDVISNIASICLIKKSGKPMYYISAPTPRSMPKNGELFVPVAWVSTTTDKTQCNMEIKYVESGGWHFPYLVNTHVVNGKTLLMRVAEPKKGAVKPNAETTASNAEPSLKKQKTF